MNYQTIAELPFSSQMTIGIVGGVLGSLVGVMATLAVERAKARDAQTDKLLSLVREWHSDSMQKSRMGCDKWFNISGERETIANQITEWMHDTGSTNAPENFGAENIRQAAHVASFFSILDRVVAEATRGESLAAHSIDRDLVKGLFEHSYRVYENGLFKTIREAHSKKRLPSPGFLGPYKNLEQAFGVSARA
jgi:hypothetical protein